MKTTLLPSVQAATAVLALLLTNGVSMQADELAPGNLKGSVTMELVGQAQVLSP